MNTDTSTPSTERILIVEDEVPLQRLISEVLTSTLGYPPEIIDIANSKRDAEARLREQEYKCIVMDGKFFLNADGSGKANYGEQMIRNIREGVYEKNAGAHILFHTAEPHVTLEGALRLGANSYVAKPSGLDDVAKAIPAFNVPALPTSTVDDRRKVLVVDAEQGVYESIRWVIQGDQGRGYPQDSIHHAKNWQEAEALLKANHYTAITLGGTFPGYNAASQGIALLQKIRSGDYGNQNKRSCILFVSGSGQATAQDATYAGANAVFSKPFDADAMASAIPHASPKVAEEEERRRQTEQDRWKRE